MRIPEMKNILLANHLSGNYLAGSELFLLWLAKRLKEGGFSPFFLSNSPGEITTLAEKYGIRQAVFPHEMLWDLLGYNPDIKGRFNRFISSNEKSVIFLKKFLNRNDIHLVISNCIVNPLPAVAAKEMGLPVIWKINETLGSFDGYKNRLKNIVTFNRCRHSIGRILDAFADRIIFPSRLSQKSFRSAGLPLRKVNVVGFPVTDEIYEDSSKFKKPSRNGFTVGFAGTHARHKGVIDFIKAAKVISERAKNVKFVLAGSAPFPEFLSRVKSLALKTGIFDKMEFLGTLKDMRPFYRMVDVLFFPSRYPEPFGMVAGEALSYGIPVIIYKGCGITELLKNGYNAVLVRRSHASMAKKAIEIIRDPVYRDRISAAARETANLYMAPDSIFTKYVEIIKMCERARS